MLSGVIYLAAFIVSCLLLGRWLPFPEVGMVRAKLEHLAAHGDDYDVIFIGSSRIHEQVLPEIFDRVAGENGVPVKSFNAGIVAMVSPEDSYLLDEILRRPHRRLRWVFFELSRLQTLVWGEHTARFGYWHDNARWMFIARRLRVEALGRLKKLKRENHATFAARWTVWTNFITQLAAHTNHWLVRATNLSRGSDILNRSLRTPGFHFDVGKELGPRVDGWMAAGTRFQQMSPPQRAVYDETYADRVAKPATKDRGDDVCQSVLEHMLAAITKAGAHPVMVIPPTTAEWNFYPTEERERQYPVLDFSDVQKFSELFAPKHRVDVGHINTAGAEFFTEYFARDFVELAKGQAPNSVAPGLENRK